MRRLTKTVVLLALFTARAPALSAQWGVSAEIGVARFGGTSLDSSGAAVGPYRPTTFALRLDWESGVVRVAVATLYARTGLAAERGGVAVVDYAGASLFEVGPEVSLRLARFGAGVVARVEAGPALDFWDLDGDRRTRLGARAALGLEWPLNTRFTGSLRAAGVLSGSMVNHDEVPDGVQRRATRRGGVSVGLRFRL